MTDLIELADRCEGAAIEQVGYAVTRDPMPVEARQEYAQFAGNLFACAAALRARASMETPK
jgi:hypothetical protein